LKNLAFGDKFKKFEKCPEFKKLWILAKNALIPLPNKIGEVNIQKMMHYKT
jgi:hypothetical protein